MGVDGFLVVGDDSVKVGLPDSEASGREEEADDEEMAAVMGDDVKSARSADGAEGANLERSRSDVVRAIETTTR